MDNIPNPFEHRQFSFTVLPEEKDIMTRAKHHSLIMPTLKIRLQQLITTRVWENIMFALSVWSLISLLIENEIPQINIFLELIHELTQAALCIEVFSKLFIDYCWFFRDAWNLYDLTCVILNSPLIYNLFLSDYVGIPPSNSIQRLFRTLHAIRIIRIHKLLRYVIETIGIALSNIYNVLLLEFVIVTVFALLSIALEGGTHGPNSEKYDPYENYTEAMYSYYMCITLEGVNEIAEQILPLDSPQFTTAIRLIFYIFAALTTYSIGQLEAAVIATTLSRAINRLTQNSSSTKTSEDKAKPVGIRHPTIEGKMKSKPRSNNINEVQTFSQLRPDDLALLLILYQNLDKNILEYENIIRDIDQMAQFISKLNQKRTVHNQSQF